MSEAVVWVIGLIEGMTCMLYVVGKSKVVYAMCI